MSTPSRSTGRQGRTRHQGRHAGGARSAPQLSRSPAQPAAAAPALAQPSLRKTRRARERVTMTPLRKRIAERLVEAQHTAAILTTFNEVDMTAVMALRATVQGRFEKKHGVKLGFMSFFVKACVDALKVVPEVNAEIDGTRHRLQELLRHRRRRRHRAGLVVPSSATPTHLGFAEIEKTIADVAAQGARRQDHDRRPARAARSRSPTAASTARCCRRRSSTRRRAASSACTRSRSARSSRRPGRRSAR